MLWCFGFLFALFVFLSRVRSYSSCFFSILSFTSLRLASPQLDLDLGCETFEILPPTFSLSLSFKYLALPFTPVSFHYLSALVYARLSSSIYLYHRIRIRFFVISGDLGGCSSPTSSSSSFVTFHYITQSCFLVMTLLIPYRRRSQFCRVSR